MFHLFEVFLEARIDESIFVFYKREKQKLEESEKISFCYRFIFLYSLPSPLFLPSTGDHSDFSEVENHCSSTCTVGIHQNPQFLDTDSHFVCCGCHRLSSSMLFKRPMQSYMQLLCTGCAIGFHSHCSSSWCLALSKKATLMYFGWPLLFLLCGKVASWGKMAVWKYVVFYLIYILDALVILS